MTMLLHDPEDDFMYSRKEHTPQESFEDFLDLVSSPKVTKKSINVKEMSINKLRYSEVGFVGREVESEILNKCFQRVIASPLEAPREHPDETDTICTYEEESSDFFEEQISGNRELVLIKGYSGVGKSALASRLEAWTNDLSDGLLVRGKFEQTSQRPYSGIAQAFDAVFRSLQNMSITCGCTGLLNKIREALILELGSEIHLLLGLIPEMKIILEEGDELSSAFLKEGNDCGAEQERWKYAFRVLTNVLCSCFAPLIVVLDDLQWADVASLSVMEYLLVDSQNSSSLLVVGCYRSNEVDERHILTSIISNLAEKNGKNGFRITQLELGNFALKEANCVVMALLGIDDPLITAPLTEVCYNRTLGNPFFLIEFVTMLDSEELITFNLGLLKWVWDVKKVEESTMSARNVVDLLKSRMNRQGEDVQLILQFAANLGACFSQRLIEVVWKLHSSNHSKNGDHEHVQCLLKTLQSEMYIEQSRNDRYAWVHDKVQEAALTLGNSSSPMFQFEMGSILLKHLEEDEVETYLFEIVNLINKGSSKKKLEFCKLNLKAAVKAKDLSAFHSAATYVSQGVEMLPRSRWLKEHRGLALSLLTVGAEVELASRNIEKMEEYIKEAFENGNCSPLEKFPLHQILMYKQSTIDLQYNETIKYSISVLKELGCSVATKEPMMAIQGFKFFLKTMRNARKERRDYAGTLPAMTDETQKAIMHILYRMFYASFMSQSAAPTIWSVMKMVELTLKNGVCDISASALATLGLLAVMIRKDLEMSIFFANSAIELQKRAPSKFHEAVTLYTAVAAGVAFTQPWQSSQRILLDAYDKGLKSGNSVYAMWASCGVKFLTGFNVGKALGPLFDNGRRAVALMEELKQTDQAIISRSYCQTIANLSGRSENTVILKGKYFNGVEKEVVPSLKFFVALDDIMLSVYFGDYKRAGKLASNFGITFERTAPCHILYQCETFYRGIALYARARQTGKWRYRRSARNQLRKLKTWLEKGNPNVKHFHILLKAEQEALRKNLDESESLYQEAIVTSARFGHIHIAGLACERYADFLLKYRDDKYESDYQIDRAAQFYHDWGAYAVVERVRGTKFSPSQRSTRSMKPC